MSPLVRGACTKDGCGKPHQARGLCATHYKAWHDGRLREAVRAAREAEPRLCEQCGTEISPNRRAGTRFCDALCKSKSQRKREKARPARDPAPPCSVENCNTPKFSLGLCSRHYSRLRSKGSLDDARKNAKGVCSRGDCSQEHVARGLCDQHYRHQLRAERRQRLASELADRRCLHCDEPIPAKRNAAALFCTRACKQKERVASGKAAEVARRHYFGKLYGLSVDQVNEMAERGCGICGTTDWPGRHQRPHVDHDHKTGKVRGILCSECNTGLGKFRDDPAVLERAIAYLLKAGRPPGVQTVLI